MILNGLVIKKHSNFYYVRLDEKDLILECNLRERLKKEDQEVVVGDYVELGKINEDSNQAVITQIFDRKSYITRPGLANMDQNIIILALNQPPLSLNHLDRFLIHTQLSSLEKIICINKCDLKDKTKILSKVRKIYKSLGIKVIEISAKNHTGLESLIECLKNKKSIFSGPTGVGKSTILNVLKPELKLKTGIISPKSNRGTHTTRHTELINLTFDDNSSAIIADTPGFSYLKFDQYLPEEIEAQFYEFNEYKNECFYNNCLHINEVDCGIKNNQKKFYPSRYENYCRFVEEAIEYKEKLSSISIKDEGKVKVIDGTGKNQIRKLKLGHNLVDMSRKTYKQKLSTLTSTNEEGLDENID